MSDIFDDALKLTEEAVEEMVEADALRRLQAEIERLRAALQEISKGKGPFSRDPLEHAENCIEDMKSIALGALDGTWRPSDE